MKLKMKTKMKLKLTPLIILLLFFATFSCAKSNGIDVIINNKSNYTVTNVSITTSEHVETKIIDSIRPNEEVTTYLALEKNKTDGAYIITFEMNSQTTKVKDGYYTNGVSLNDWMKLHIENDRHKVKFSPISHIIDYNYVSKQLND